MATTFSCLLVCHSHGLGEVTTSLAIPEASFSGGKENASPWHLPEAQGASAACAWCEGMAICMGMLISHGPELSSSGSSDPHLEVSDAVRG